MWRPTFRWPVRSILRHATALTLLISAGTVSAKEKLIFVDCDNKAKISVALLDESPALRIEFKGRCEEDVLITRSNTTLIGVAAGARIVGALVPITARQPAVTVRDAHNVTLQDFAIQDSDSRAIELRSSGPVNVRSIVADGNARGGLLAIEGSYVRITDSSFSNHTIGDGIGAWDNSGLVLEGQITANNNARVGILLSGSSSLAIALGTVGAQVTTNGNLIGFYEQIGSTAQMSSAAPVSLTASGNTILGLQLMSGSAFAGGATVTGGLIGVEVDAASFEGDIDVSGAEFAGVYGWLDSFVWLRNSTVTGSDYGVYLDGATAQIANSDLTGNVSEDLHLEFGSKGSFNGTVEACTVVVDGTSITRGTTVCPPAVQSPRVLSQNMNARRGPAGKPAKREPLQLLP